MSSDAHLIYGFKIHSTGQCDSEVSEDSEELYDRLTEVLGYGIKKEFEVDIVCTGYNPDDTCTYFLGFQVMWVSDYGSDAFEPDKLFREQDQQRMFQVLKEFCDKHGVEFKHPKWYLAASYG